MTYTQVWDVIQGQVHDSLIQRDEDGAFIPFDEANVDYVDYLWWLYDGNAPNPPPADPTPPMEEPPLDLHAQVQDIEARLSALEADLGR
jgi:hypothetical protein